MNRMEKYQDNDKKKSRLTKNSKLYDEVSDINIDYIDINYDNAVVINPKKMVKNNREDFQKVKQLNGLIVPKETNKEDIKEVKEEKIYDINEILKKAKENKLFDNDNKKRLINTEYNILSKLDIDEIDKKEELSKDDLHNLINKIYDNNTGINKTLRKVRYEDDVDDMGDTTESKLSHDNDDTNLDSAGVSNGEQNLLEDLIEKTLTNKGKIVEDDITAKDSVTDIVLSPDICKNILDKEDTYQDDTETTVKFDREGDNKKADSDVTDTMLDNINKTKELEKLERKSKVSLIIITIIVFILIAVGCYLLYKYFSS